ncbi:DedA family protein [Homoserinibacter sp. GY 40078]|uniref:DedA family protein n=1 Tax=Homoserinibacter sp. GY 40078 TaxID=2603275 RepID=UPI0011CBB719|nr:VTT domain-containing protein [Homoserinibacter sp. GY 40078]TXK17783.1 DedA family protein [Homoserinibacter sp. GY 40078]
MALIAAAPTALVPWLDPHAIIVSAGPWALLVVCLIVFAETGLLVGFILPGDTLLVITGLLTFTGTMTAEGTGIQIPIWVVCLAIAFAAFLGGEVGYLIGHKAGPRIFERKESGLFSKENVVRTNAFLTKWGPLAIVLARFVPIVRTFAPVAAGVGHMNYKRYSLYNAVGAFIWGAGLTFAGFILGYIPPLADFVVDYIDIILLLAIALAVIPTVFHYVQSLVKARRARAAGVEPLTDEQAAIDPQVLDD